MAFGRSSQPVPAYIMKPRIAMLLAVLALVLIGFVMVYSASFVEAIHEGESANYYFIKQVGYGLFGIVVALILWKLVPSRWWGSNLIWAVWGVAMALMVATLFFGTEDLGAKRWLLVGPISIQSSELVKIALIMMMAKLFTSFREGRYSVKEFIAFTVIFVVIPLAFMFKAQSDLGSTLIIGLGLYAVLWVGEIDSKTMAILVIAAIVLVIAAIAFKGYRSDRMVFMNPWNDGNDGYGTGYQLIRSYYAFAQGGLFGVGIGNSHEKFLYLPEAETDFIFAVVGEELGLVGALFVVALFLVLLVSGLKIARYAADPFDSMLAGGLTIMMVGQAFLNICCVIGLLPTTGKPMPFISSGGSSLIISLAMIGLILSISEASTNASVHERRREDLRVVRSSDSRGRR